MPADIPEYIFSKPSTRPGEPETTGMELGPGAGPEALQMNNEPETEQEIALQFLVDTFQDEAAFNMLNEIRNERVQPPAEPPFSAMPLASRADAPSGGEEGPGPLPPEDMLDPFASDIPFEDEMETASTTPAADAEVVEEAAVPVGGDETASAPATTGDAEA